MNNQTVLLGLISLLAVSGLYLFQSEASTEYGTTNGTNSEMKYFK